jgi:hypothetical protein
MRGEVTALLKRLSINPENVLSRQRAIVTRITEMSGKSSAAAATNCLSANSKLISF